MVVIKRPRTARNETVPIRSTMLTRAYGSYIGSPPAGVPDPPEHPSAECIHEGWRRKVGMSRDGTRLLRSERCDTSPSCPAAANGVGGCITQR
jgi:hypothetical protein